MQPKVALQSSHGSLGACMQAPCHGLLAPPHQANLLHLSLTLSNSQLRTEAVIGGWKGSEHATGATAVPLSWRRSCVSRMPMHPVSCCRRRLPNSLNSNRFRSRMQVETPRKVSTEIQEASRLQSLPQVDSLEPPKKPAPLSPVESKCLKKEA